MDFTGFEWDRGNRDKCQKHGLSITLIESIFDQPVTVLPDAGHSQTERRMRAIGRTIEGRFAFVVFTVRQTGEQVLIRPISARYMHRTEVSSYEEAYPNLQNR
ncbi:MAG: uncharacterized protein QOH98_1098 [Methylobacteriaceae bacterium]|jgi:hypothetical protein|nr:uncharacterized protein [Methylobacteriaceae bacterium]